MHHGSYTNINHDITDMKNQRMVKNTRTSISCKQNVTFLQYLR